MAKRNLERVETAGSCCEHDWKPLFGIPVNAEEENSYLSRGHSDYVECLLCGAVAMREKANSEKMLTLSYSFSELKRREALIWQKENDQRRVDGRLLRSKKTA